MEAINHEYYVSPELAKLLEKAGFDWKCNHYYFTQNGKTEAKSDFRHPAQNYNEKMAAIDSKSFEFEVCSRPILEVAQRWLREVKGFYVNIIGQCKNNRYGAYLESVDFKSPEYLGSFDTYEEAQEAGEKKALEMILEKGE